MKIKPILALAILRPHHPRRARAGLWSDCCIGSITADVIRRSLNGQRPGHMRPGLCTVLLERPGQHLGMLERRLVLAG